MIIELRALVLLLRRSVHWIALSGLLGLLVGVSLGLWSSRSPLSGALVSVSYETLGDARGPAQLDGYYIIETERRFGELLAQTLRSDQLKNDFFRATGASLGRVERVSFGDLRIVWRGGTTDVESTAQTLADILSVQFGQAAGFTGEPLSVRASVSRVYAVKPLSQTRLAFAGVLLGLLCGVFIVLLRYYFRESGDSV